MLGGYGGLAPPTFHPSAPSSASCSAGNDYCSAPLSLLPHPLLQVPPLMPGPPLISGPSGSSPSRRSIGAVNFPSQPIVGLCIGRNFVGTTKPCACPANCFSCEVNTQGSAKCLSCKNAHHLLDGLCMESCPPGFEGIGLTLFGRRCQKLVSAVTSTTAATLHVAQVPFKTLPLSQVHS